LRVRAGSLSASKVRLSYAIRCPRRVRLAVKLGARYSYFAGDQSSVNLNTSLRRIKVGLYVSGRVVSVRTVRVR
jgi:CRISPR/Cas system-associated exonuclease Cas4 (RecB family)